MSDFNQNDDLSPEEFKKSLEQSSNCPLLDINISEDKMLAHVSIVSDNKNQKLTPEILINELKLRGVISGVSLNAIEKVVEQWNRDGKIPKNTLIAEGIAPDIGEAGKEILNAAGITDPDILTKIKALETPHIASVLELCKAGRVNNGQAVLKKDASKKMIGTNVFGEQTMVSSRVQPGSGVEYNEKNAEYFAMESGILSFIDNTLEIIPVIFTHLAKVNVSPGHMQASITLFPAHQQEPQITENDAFNALKEAGIKIGINEDLVKTAVQKCIQENRIINEVVAEGIASIDGKNGEVEYLKDFNESLKPKLLEDGSADFKDISLIKSVSKYEKLARLHPPEKGIPGTNLFGDALPARDGVPEKMPCGNNTEVSKEDDAVLIASITGNARLNHNLLEVTDCYVVGNDVDYETGNISYPKTLLVKGDVKSGFTVEVGQDAEIHGIVEDSNVRAGGKVLIRAGFIGSGAGLIEAKDDVGLAYIRNQKVRCRKNITIAGEAINSQLFARSNIEVGGRKLGIVGGMASARREIICESAGNESGIRTTLEAGVDFALIEEKYKTEDKIKELSGSKIKIDEHLNKLGRIKKMKKVLTQKETILLKKLVEMQIKIKKQLDTLDERKALISEKIGQIGNARIIVHHTVYPGVTIKIGGNMLTIEKKLTGPKTFIMKSSDIKVL
ncbi:MAG: DUF342 domain-containing protein [Fibrobacteria bacterium]|nr:DUF342 domain-containing protein [Fibrobacteria bacterium]